MTKHYEHIKKHRHARKKLLVDCLGGKCIRCGYYKCIHALEFHHIDPKQKDFNVGQKIKNLTACLNEIKKCVLLCSTCHKELHYNVWSLDGITIPVFDQSVIDKYNNSLRTERTITCSECGTKFYHKNKRKVFCTDKCCRKSQSVSRRIVKQRPGFVTLKEQVRQLGFVGTSKLYGVTDNCIRKWLGVKNKKELLS